VEGSRRRWGVPVVVIVVGIGLLAIVGAGLAVRMRGGLAPANRGDERAGGATSVGAGKP